MQNVIEEVNKLLNQNTDSISKNNNVNIFNILGVEHKEVRMCRFLAWLINPKESHRCGDLFLKSFMETIIGKPIANYKDAVVETEYPIDADLSDGSRRIDIVIYNKEFFFPIEVKIDADDQEAQCYDYHEFVNKSYPDSKIYYLTKFGNKPSIYSLMSRNGEAYLSLNDVVCISFCDDIWNWLDGLICDDILLKALIVNYKDSIGNFTGRYEMEGSKVLDSYISNNPKKLKEAIEVADSVELYKVELTTRILSDFEAQMKTLVGKYNLDDSCNNIKALRAGTYKYHVNKADNYPCLKYFFRDIKLDKDICLTFVIEIGNNLYCGFRAFNVKSNSYVVKFKSEYVDTIKKFFDISKFRKSDWFAAWSYLPEGNAENNDALNINVRNCNDNYIALVDEKERKAVIEKSVKYIEEVWLKPINIKR